MSSPIPWLTVFAGGPWGPGRRNVGGPSGAEWLALGKLPLYFIPSGIDPPEAKEQGLPVGEIIRPMKEGSWLSSGGTGTIGHFNKAAHPNASKLFVSWWLSKEGQLLAMKQNPIDAVGCQLSVVSYRLSAVSDRLSAVGCQPTWPIADSR